MFKAPNNWVFPQQAEYPDYVTQTLDYVLGLLETHNLEDKISYGSVKTTVGRAGVYKAAEAIGLKPKEIDKYLPLSKKNIPKLLTYVYDHVESEKALWFYWMIQHIGFLYSTKNPSSYTDETYEIPDSIIKKRNKLVADLQAGKINEVEFNNKLDDLSKELLEYYKKNNIPISDIIESGAAKNEVENIKRMFLARGLSINSQGEVNTVVTSSHSEGLSPEDYFKSSSEAITNLYQKSKSTAIPGYFIRSLSELLAGVFISENDDCKSKNHLSIKITDSDLAKSVVDRYDDKGKLISSAPRVGSTVKLRSPLYCLAQDGICRKCLGEALFKLGFKPGDSTLIAVTSIADALTATALKASHTGQKLNLEAVDFTKEI